MTILPIPAFNDNYIWLLHDEKNAWVVDPGDSTPVLATLRDLGLSLEGILITHHHADHIGGVAELMRQAPDVCVIGPRSNHIDIERQYVREADIIEVLGRRFSVLEIPGHTLDHIAYFSDSADEPIVFCGDTLFAGGCGRVFEGTYPQMLNSLERLAALPANTQVFCAHEYTLANLDFALAVEPLSDTLAQRIDQAQTKRAQFQPTLPSTIALELDTNPFLRTKTETVIQSAVNNGAVNDTSVEVFSCIREWKNNY